MVGGGGYKMLIRHLRVRRSRRRSCRPIAPDSGIVRCVGREGGI